MKSPFELKVATAAKIWGLVAGCVVSVLWVCGASAADAPIVIYGFNRDVVIEASAGAALASFGQAFDTVRNYGFVERGWQGAGLGLPSGGEFTSIADRVTQFQFGPFAGNNVLYLDSGDTSGTLSLSEPRAYTSLSILAASAIGGGDGTLVLNFADQTSSEPLTYSAPNWYGGTGNTALRAFGHADFTLNMINFDGTRNPRLFQTSLDLVALGYGAEVLDSVTYYLPAGATASGVFALSGTPVPIPTAVPEPTMLALMGLGGAGWLVSRRGRGRPRF